MSNQIKEMPLIALRKITIFPNMLLNFDVNRDKSKVALDRAMAMDSQEIFVVMQRDPEVYDPSFDDLCSIGVVAKVKQLAKLPGNVVRVLVEGKVRAELIKTDDDGEAKNCVVAVCDEQKLPEELVEEAMCRTVKELFASYSVLNTRINKELVKVLQDTQSLDYLLDQIMIQMPVDYEVKQKILELVDITERYEAVVEILSREREILRIKKEFKDQVKERIDKNQKDYIMREQMKLIREELGEDDAREADKYSKELARLKADKAVKDKIKDEITRLEHMGINNAESNVIRSYIETLLSLPWNKASKDVLDIKAAEDILEKEHYGLSKVKERVLEFLSVRAFAKKGDSPIICLVGPPGTGKTSIARSIAKALNREYVRICLGGVRDEAEIRGHRRTYVGAMPGRIVTGLKNAGVRNPLMLLDEIDKVSSDYKGDTSSALLEVLDSEQNNKFCDHYVEIPVDLSDVMFVATANSAGDIPKPLLDRMEIIELSGYTENEKEHIARDYLVPRQIEKHGLNGKITISDKAIKDIIHSYTREAGVRGLERKIGAVCRKAAKELLEGKKTKVRITEANLKNYLGKELHRFNPANEKPEIGIVRGLAWTNAGGDTLEIEVATMPGKGELVLTGKLGDVMKESARIALSYVRYAACSMYDVKPEFFEKNDIHVHVPEGAVPKDGPSAGITMSLAILSAVIKKPVRADVAMTGEVTLRGRVLPIGGLKEKLLAAKLAGIKTVLVPDKNKNDVEEISAEIKNGMEIIFVSSMDEVIEHGFYKAVQS